MKSSPTNSHEALELAYRNYPVETLSINTIPYMELGKAYHMEIYNYQNLQEYDIWLCIPVQFADHYSLSNVFKVLATNNFHFKPGSSTGYADIKCDTFRIQSYRNVHEIFCEDFPLYLNLDYKSSLFFDSIEKGEFKI